MGTVLFLVFHFIFKFDTLYDFVILSFLVSLDSIFILKLLELKKK